MCQLVRGGGYAVPSKILPGPLREALAYGEEPVNRIGADAAEGSPEC